MKKIKRTSNCIGNITGKCPYTDNIPCAKKSEEECFPPVCKAMIAKENGMIWCEYQKKLVDPVEVCLKCNPKDNL